MNWEMGGTSWWVGLWISDAVLFFGDSWLVIRVAKFPISFSSTSATLDFKDSPCNSDTLYEDGWDTFILRNLPTADR